MTRKEAPSLAVQALTDPLAWVDKARVLRWSAEIIESKVRTAENRVKRRLLDPNSNEPPGPIMSAEADLFPVAQMLFQMSYENAFKGLIALRGEEPPESHNMEQLARMAGVPIASDVLSRYLELLTRANQLGRFNVGLKTVKETDVSGRSARVRKHFHGSRWSSEHYAIRGELDFLFKQAWIENRGAFGHSDLSVLRGKL